MRVTAGAAGVALLSPRLLSTSKAAVAVDPKPIPGGLQFLFPDPTVFHVEAPGYPGSGFDPATNDPSIITDFNGYVGVAYLTGMGTHTDRKTGHVSRLPFEVDLRFMQGTYVGIDGNRHGATFALIWLDVYEVDQFGQRAAQIHDFNPGISDSGLFWNAAVDSQGVQVNPRNGSASMQVRDIRIEDYHDFPNSLVDGPSERAIASLRIDWLASQDRHHFRDPGNGFDAEVRFNTAQVAWTGRTDTARYVSDPASTSTTLFAEFGHEHNGIFF